MPPQHPPRTASYYAHSTARLGSCIAGRVRQDTCPDYLLGGIWLILAARNRHRNPRLSQPERTLKEPAPPTTTGFAAWCERVSVSVDPFGSGHVAGRSEL